MTKFEQDKIDRKEIVNRICLLVDNLQKDQHFCLALDGEWGSGKSFVLEYIEEELQKHEEYIVVKYDAWKNSFYQDPLIAILYCILDSVKEYFYYVDTVEEKFKRVAKFLKGSLQQFLNKAMRKVAENPDIEVRKIAIGYYAVKKVAGIIKAFSVNQILSYEKFNDFQSYQHLLKQAQTLLNEIADYQMYKKKQTKLIILVDEIDRCLPDEQLKILERLHHLFDVKNCAVICALNKTSISKTFAKTYDGDGKQYLRKFFDYVVHLGVKADVYLSYLLRKDLSQRLEKIFPAEKMEQNVYYKLGMRIMPYQVAELACHYVLQVAEKNNLQHIISNREISRYYDNLLAIIDEFGWKNLNGQYLFFAIFGLFVNKFIKHQFFVEKMTPNPIAELNLQPKVVSQTYSKDIIYEDEFINDFKTAVLNLRQGQHWQDHSYGEVAEGNEFHRLGLLIIRYGGQDEYNER